MVEFINSHWVLFILSLAYLLGVFCYWQSSLFTREDWWLAFVVPLSYPVFLARRYPAYAALVGFVVVIIWGIF